MEQRMTPTQLETSARQRYNATNDAFFTSAEVMDLIYQAQMELALKGRLIERTYTTTTVAGTQEYAFPSNAIEIRRVEYNGQKLEPITQREDDTITGLSAATTNRGTPKWYYVWNYSIFLRPIPDSAVTLKVFSYSKPDTVSTTSTLDVPVEFHPAILDYILRAFAEKDKNYQGSQVYEARWKTWLMESVKFGRRRKRADAYAHAINSELLPETVIGSI